VNGCFEILITFVFFHIHFYGIEISVEKTKIMIISRQPFPIKIMIDPKQLENVEYF
jgi:hypothetical protein